MLVRNNTTSIRILGYQVEAENKAERKPPSIRNVTLVPGNNEVEPEVWEQLAKNANVRTLLEDDDTENGKPVLEVDAKVSLKDISKLDTKKAVKVVKGTFDRGLLRHWQRTEVSRREVADAVDAQLRAVDPRAKAEDATTEIGASDAE